jgi:dTDP-4-amino-4,6-dideoxygalactose transaminase
MIPLVDLKAQYASIKSEIDEAIHRVLDNCQYILGPEVAAFEQEFADYCGSVHGVGVSSGTAALHMALLAADVGPGDEVITTPFTFVATVAAIEYAGARPVLVDIDPQTFCIDVGALEAAVTPRTKALIPVHLFGQPADMRPILDIARRRGIRVIEDAAQAHGSEYEGRRVGSLGDMACFSFYPAKNLGAVGEGGMVVTADDALAKKLRLLRDWGAERKYHHVIKGFNMRLEGIQGAVLRVKLRHLERWTEARRAIAGRYDAALGAAGVATPVVRPGCRHVYHTYTLRLPQRDRCQQHLSERGIGTGIHYPVPVHLMPAYQDLGYRAGEFPQAERAAGEVLALPVFPELTESQQQVVIEAVTSLPALAEAGSASAIGVGSRPRPAH